MPFKKGTSGNPGGRRKLSDADRMLLCGSTSKAINRQVELMDCEDGQVAIRATNAVLDRYYGKPLQMIDLDADISTDDPFAGMNNEEIEAMELIMDKAKNREGEEDGGDEE